MNNQEYLTKLRKAGIKILDSDIVYVAGSLIEGKISSVAEGMGNEYSDVDVFILRKEQATKIMHTYSINDRSFDFKFVDNTHFDVETYKLEKVKNIFSQISNVSFKKNKNVKRQIALPNGWTFTVLNSIIHRLFHSIPLQNEMEWESLKQELDFEKYLHVYSQILKNKIDDTTDDVVGNAIQGTNTLPVSIYVLRQSYIYFLNMILLANKITNDREKWTQLKFNNLVEKTGKYISVKQLEQDLFFKNFDNNPEETRLFIFKVQNFINDYIEKMETKNEFQ